MSKNRSDRERQERLTALKKLFQRVAPAGIPGERYGTNRKLGELVQELGLTVELLDAPDLPSEAKLCELLATPAQPAPAAAGADLPVPEPSAADFAPIDLLVDQPEPSVSETVPGAVPDEPFQPAPAEARIEPNPDRSDVPEPSVPQGTGGSDTSDTRPEPDLAAILEEFSEADGGEPEADDAYGDRDLLGEAFEGGGEDGEDEESLRLDPPPRLLVQPVRAALTSRQKLVIAIGSAAALVFVSVSLTVLFIKSRQPALAVDPAVVATLRSENAKLRTATSDATAKSDAAEQQRKAAHMQVLAAEQLAQEALAGQIAALERETKAREEREKEDEDRARATHASRTFKSLRDLSDEDAERLAQMSGLDKDQVKASTPDMLDAQRRIRELQKQLKQRPKLSAPGTAAPTAPSVSPPPPKAEAGGDRTVNVGIAVDFDGAASTGNIQEYRWRFGDGDEATGKTVAHTYATSSMFTVTLTVTDDRGQTAQDSFTVTVK
ncbi:MAG: lipoprotein cytochrome c, 27 heme-binding site [Parcubacteria group bacterium Gr01-1014_31]|nr:MAG: lipoprotein cytochrome c, 27 heme-binding site [Parcubacteria group bacterium Gr01-1014_31]